MPTRGEGGKGALDALIGKSSRGVPRPPSELSPSSRFDRRKATHLRAESARNARLADRRTTQAILFLHKIQTDVPFRLLVCFNTNSTCTTSSWVLSRVLGSNRPRRKPLDQARPCNARSNPRRGLRHEIDAQRESPGSCARGEGRAVGFHSPGWGSRRPRVLLTKGKGIIG